MTYDTSTNKLIHATTTEINTITVGDVTIHGTGKDYGITIGDTTKHVMISDHDISATGSVHASIISSGINARMSDGKVVAQNGLYIGYDGTDITKATYDNSRFAVNGENGSFKAANGKFTVSGSGAITADSLALTGTDGTTNVGAAIKDNANNIQAVDGKVTNIQTDVTSLKTTTGQLQTKVGELTASDTAARNDIISLQKKTAGISEDGSEITTNSLKLRESGSLEEQEITAAKVKGYDEVVVAVGDTSTEGTLAYNTQKIKFKKDNKITSEDATYIEGITHAGDVRLANGEVRAKSIVLEEVVDDGTAEQATLTRESIVNLHGMIDGKTKIKVADGSEVGGVTFDQGKVTNVVSINDNLKFESDGIYLNKGDQAKQIKIGTDGKIIIGTSSSAYDTNGFYAGGHDYENAKAALNASDGSIKGANGKFGVDKDGNVTTEGNIQGKDITATGALNVAKDATVGGNLGVNGDTTVGGDLTVTKKIKGESLNIGATGSEFTVDTVGHMTSKSAKIGSVGIDNTGAITGVTSLTTNALTVTGAFTTGGNLTVNGDLTANGAINGKTISISDGGSIAGVNFETGGKLTATTGTIGGVSFATGGVVSGVKEFTSAKISDGQGTIITSGKVESKTAKIGAISIDNEIIEGSSANGLTIENVKIKDGVVSDVTSLTANSATIGGVNTLDNTGITVATGKKIQVGSKTVIEDGSIAVSNNTKLTDQALNLNTTNTWTAAGGLVADKATVNGVVLGADGDTGKATFTDANGSTTIAGKNITTGKIIADELLIDKISLGKNGSSNISIDNSGNVTTEGEITIKDATGAVMSKLSQDKATFGKDAMNKTTISKGDITATAKNAADSQQSTLTHNNKGFKVEGKDAGGTKASSFGFDTSTGIGTFTGQDNSTTAIDGSNMTLVNGDNKTELTAGGVTFTGKDYKDATAKGTTVINGNTITTGKLVTDELVITGQGNADGNGGSIAFGGNGTIKSDINDGNGKNTSFETKLDGVNTKVTDGTTTTENQVTAAGNSNTVTKDEKHKSEFNQGLTSIGGVVTNGTINVAQNLDGVNGLLTNEVTDADGKSSMLKQSGTGLTYTDSANTGNETRINSSDVSIGSESDPDKRINLSDLGQIDELDQEIRNNEEYQNNKTAVGGINAEAAIRRGEVERLDNRISEEVTRLDGRINDVNDRVNKVGAMAAAIASLKSIGYDPQAPSEFSIGLGQYKGETGVAMGFFHYPNKNFMINVSLSTAGGETMGGIGATWRFGHKSPQKLLEEQREAQAKKELAAAEKYQAAAKLAKEAQERAEYAAKLARQAQVSADNAKAAADATQAKHFG
ncbi:YadA-like family protein [Phascolarctobacterium succinatutens]|uniref:YadA-like family protein n=1 Tax=Phascolarctobacterium succinatutens TaxID=626940 RepID=UPI0026EE4606|nr:YadA-like family protein [Phascolarctobacterium succinatutens]